MTLLWDWLRKVWDYIVQSEDVATVLLGLVGLGLLWWRSKSSDRQAKAAQAQIDLAQLDSLYDRYQKSADMLGNANMSTRLGGIYSLRRLADKHPDEFHLQVMEILCAFLRNPPLRAGQSDPGRGGIVPESMLDRKPAEDVQSALDAVIYRSDRGIEIEKATEADSDRTRHFRIDLRGANLKDARFSGGNLQGAIMVKAQFGTADFTSAELNDADLSGTSFSQGRRRILDQETGKPMNVLTYSRVTQRQLDQAIANPDDPPVIPVGTPDIETGEPIVWNDELCGDRWIEWQKILNPKQDATGIGSKGLRAFWPFRYWFAR